MILCHFLALLEDPDMSLPWNIPQGIMLAWNVLVSILFHLANFYSLFTFLNHLNIISLEKPCLRLSSLNYYNGSYSSLFSFIITNIIYKFFLYDYLLNAPLLYQAISSSGQISDLFLSTTVFSASMSETEQTFHLLNHKFERLNRVQKLKIGYKEVADETRHLKRP